MGNDYAPTFLHEFVHAIDRILPDYCDEEYYSELVAECAMVVICRTYNIQMDTSYSINYLKLYTNSETEMKIRDIIKRVLSVCEYIKNCINWSVI
jgi:hypothetical protein